MDLQACVQCASKQGEFRAELGIPQNEPLVGIVGRMVPIKNHILFLQTARILLHNGFDGGFVIVGDEDACLDCCKPDSAGHVHCFQHGLRCIIKALIKVCHR